MIAYNPHAAVRAGGSLIYHTATKQVTHGAPSIEVGFAGVAIKQQEQSWTLGIANRNVIGIGERFAIQHVGTCKVASSLLPGAAIGDSVQIVPATNALTRNTGLSATSVAFGRVVGIPGDNRGTPTGFVVIDMGARDNQAIS